MPKRHQIVNLCPIELIKMYFSAPVVSAKLVRRYKRFLADIELPNGEIVTVHCANPGSMAGLTEAGSQVLCSTSPNKNRKLPLSWEMIEVASGWVGINTSNPNKLVAEALAASKIQQLAHYPSVRSEVKYGENSRVDFLLSGEGLPDCYLEVKNVHFSRTLGLAEFPDSKTARGAKHLGELAKMVDVGHRAVMLYVIQRDDCSQFKIAADFDENYAEAHQAAKKTGVETLAFACKPSQKGIELSHELPFA